LIKAYGDIWDYKKHSAGGMEHRVTLFDFRKPSPLGQVRDRWLCLGCLCLKSQIPSTKLQTNLKFQYPMTETTGMFVLGDYVRVLNFGHCYLFVFWDLLFEISIWQ